MAWIEYIIGLYLLSQVLDERGFKWTALLCQLPVFLTGVVMMSLGVLVFCDTMQQAVALSLEQPLYLPVNIIVAMLRGMTCGFIPIALLQ